MKIYIGYDRRERQAFEVCAASLRKHASAPVDIERLDLRELRQRGIYTREHDVREGRLWDVLSDAPMSTEFSLSRFLVPYLSHYHGWSLYCDCDFLFRADVADLFALARDEFAVMVVKHCYVAQQGPKMDGQINIAYPRKNWSSLMLFNCAHVANHTLTPEIVNAWPRDRLHAFRWLAEPYIGALPVEWNWIAVEPRAVHFTHGTPDMAGYQDTPYADEYRGYLKRE